MESASIKTRILSFLRAHPRQRLRPEELQRKIKVPQSELPAVAASLRELVREGKVAKLKKNHFTLAEAQNLISGRVQAHPAGFGFLLPDTPAMPDIYLSRREMGRLMHGDRVQVKLEQKGRGGPEARLVRILERGQRRIVGTYHESEGKGYLVPMDPRVGPAIELAPARGVAPGKVVAAEIVRYGTALSLPRGELLEVLGDPDDPEVQAESLIFRYRLPREFPPEARREAAAVPQAVGESDLAGRVDLRGVPFVTIDGERAQDFDDAVAVEKEGDRYVLLVAIADVAHYVQPESELDREAYRRGTSVYFPDRAIPMLPLELSHGICSLNPLADRLAKVVRLEIDARGEIRGASCVAAVIRSRARMTYTAVRRILADRDPELLRAHAPLVDRFRLMEELALLLWERRQARGSLDFDLPEAEIVLDLQGVPENVIRAERNVAHRIIEEFMIAANEAVARHLTALKIPLLYRVHEGPEERTLQELIPFLLTLGYRLPLKRGKIEPMDVQRLLLACRGKPEERVLNHVLLRAMKQARYLPENIGHFGLASACYTHFTSPIRRYPDLIVHRMLERALQRREWRPKERERLMRELEEAAEHTSARERLALDAEREMVDLKKAQFMMDKIGREFAGFVVRLAPFGFFVELEPFFVEGLVRLSSLADDAYHYYEKQHLIRGRRHGRTFRLGDRVAVRVQRITAFRGEIDFQLLERLPLEAPRVPA